jgi:hypothetical protein
MGLSLSELAKVGRALKSRRAGVGGLGLLLVALLFKAFSGSLIFFGGAPSYTNFPELGGARLPVYSAFTPSFLKSIWPLILVAITLSGLAIRLAMTIASARRRSTAESFGDESGSSAVEFVLVLPPLVALLLMILQISLVVQAKFVVNYAAFCAARSAIVIIPDDISSEPRNQLANPNASEKVVIIHHAAALPLTAVSPWPGWNVPTGSLSFSDFNDAAHLGLLLPFTVGSPPMLERVIVRAPYAYDQENTNVKVLTAQGAESGSFKDHDFVTVKVTYRYYLAVPFAKQLFGTAYSGHPFLGFLFGTAYYYPIVEQYTLPMDGEPSGP